MKRHKALVRVPAWGGGEVYKTYILSGLSQIEILVRGLSEGVYFVQVGSVTQRVVVSH